LPRSEAGGRFGRMALGAVRRLVLPRLRFLALLAALFLPPALDDRVISPPRVNKAILSGRTFVLEGANEPRIVLADVRVEGQQRS